MSCFVRTNNDHFKMSDDSEPFSGLKKAMIGLGSDKKMILFLIAGNLFTREVFASSIIAKRFQFSTGNYRFVSTNQCLDSKTKGSFPVLRSSR